MSWNRRLFIRWSAAIAAMTAAVRQRAFAQGSATASPRPGEPGDKAQTASGLDATGIRPLAEAVLPTALGRAGIERRSNEFAAWIAGYRAGEELEHPYGSDRIGRSGPSPAARWADQLAALERDALAAHRKPFAACTVDERQALVRTAVAAATTAATGTPATAGSGGRGAAPSTRMPSPIAAPHVAVALLAHFAESADGVNLAYGRRIDPRQCRPLTESPRLPVALTRAGRA